MLLKKLKEKYNQIVDFLEDVEKTKAILLVPKGMPMVPAAQQLVDERCDARIACHDAESGFVDLKNFVDNLASEVQKDISYNNGSVYCSGDSPESKEATRARLAIILSYLQTIQQRARIIESGVTEFYPDGTDNVDVDRIREKFMGIKKVEA